MADSANTRLVGSYTTLDAAVGYRLRRGQHLTLRGRNLTDEVYTQSTSNTAGRIEPPRSVELTYAMSF